MAPKYSTTRSSKKNSPNPRFWCLGFRLFIFYCKTSFQDANKWNYWRKTSNLGFAIPETSRGHNLTRKRVSMRWWDDEASVREFCTHEILGGVNSRSRCWFFWFFWYELGARFKQSNWEKTADSRDKRSISLGSLTITNRHLPQLELLNKIRATYMSTIRSNQNYNKKFFKINPP